MKRVRIDVTSPKEEEVLLDDGKEHEVIWLLNDEPKARRRYVLHLSEEQILRAARSIINHHHLQVQS